MIAIVDYGLGNIKAFANVYKRLNIPYLLASKPEDLEQADKLILPGVGAFDEAMRLLMNSGLKATLEARVRDRGVPVMGICVGMQMLAKSSEEGSEPGLGWIDGVVHKFDVEALKHKTRLPHMGWNQVETTRETPLLAGLDPVLGFYFLHSYYFQCARSSDVLAEAEYGARFCCAVNAGNVFGVQFHPEKSHSNGVRLLQNFGEM
jgi:glutamine amidotransferase